MKLLFMVLVMAVPLTAQTSIATVSAVPSGACTGDPSIKVVRDTGAIYTCSAGTWSAQTSAAGSMPSGMIAFISAGACPSGWTESTALVGFNVLVTSTAAGDVGTFGGSNTFTPQGTVSAPIFTGTQGTVPAQTFTGSSATTSAVSAGTPTGTNSSTTIAMIGTKMTTSSSGTATVTSLGGVTATTASQNVTIPAETFTGSALAAHTHTLIATGTNSSVPFTPAGTNSAPTFTGTQATITPPFFKVIACQKN